MIARTDAPGPLGFDQAPARARINAPDGAAALFVEALQPSEEVVRIADLGRATGVPVVHNDVPHDLPGVRRARA